MKLTTVLMLVISGWAHAQDTLTLNLRQADSVFIQQNVRLLAERYQIDMAKAAEIQAGLWPNPSFGLELNAYNPDRKKVLDIGSGGQKIATLQQVLLTAGKRNKSIALAVESTRMSGFQYHDLLRTLKFQLRQAFFESYFLKQSIAILDTQIDALSVTIEAFEKEYNRNNISLKEVIRLKALHFQLVNSRASIQYELSDNQRDLRNLLHENTFINPQIDSTQIRKYKLESSQITDLIQRAENRADLQMAASLTRQSEINLLLQKAMAVPNVNVGAIYDQSGSYVNHYTGLTLSVDLPFFNKNQGNIKAAKAMIDFHSLRQKANINEVHNEVSAAVRKVQEADRVFYGMEDRFNDQFKLLSKSMYDNFQKRNISLLEFIDFIETYNESVMEFNRLQSTRIMNYEALNYAIGEEVFN